MGTGITTTMDNAALYRLMAWLSPAYPVGAFSYSHGLEWLVEAGTVNDRASLTDWIADVLSAGGGRNDAILFAHAWRAAQRKDDAALLEINELAGALAPSAERYLETTAQGDAFALVTGKTWGAATLEKLPGPVAYPVAVAVAAADHGIDLATALAAYVQAISANLVSAGVRLIPLGHTDGQHCIGALEAAVAAAVADGLTAALDDLGSAVVVADIAAMKHETQYTRLFRS